jgi:hypothetical protein
MTCTLILVALFISFAWGRRALASPCISFDSDFNLLVFGLGAKDYNAGSQDLWAGGRLGSLSVQPNLTAEVYRQTPCRHHQLWPTVSASVEHGIPSLTLCNVDHSTAQAQPATSPRYLETHAAIHKGLTVPQFSNAVYILGADKTNPSAINIYDATAKAWSTQKVDTGSFDPKAFSAILDRDTNVFCEQDTRSVLVVVLYSTQVLMIRRPLPRRSFPS